MERLRSKVAGLEVRFEEVPAQGVKSSPRSKSASSLLSLGLYRNRAEEAVRENFTFPGGFAKGLQARIRLTIERDGTVSLAEVLKSSGDEKFDYAAKLAWRRTKFPPISSDIERDRITWVFSFSP